MHKHHYSCLGWCTAQSEWKEETMVFGFFFLNVLHRHITAQESGISLFKCFNCVRFLCAAGSGGSPVGRRPEGAAGTHAVQA